MRLEAEKKIRDEMEREKSSYVQVVSNFLLEQINKNPEAVKRILAEENKDKTIKKSINEMRKEAEKNKVNGCAVLTDEEGFAVVLKYYGISDTYTPIPDRAKIAKEVDFDIKLDDLL